MDAAPFLAGGRAFVPVRYLALSLGVLDKDISWDGRSRTVTLNKSGVSLKVSVSNSTLVVNGQARAMDAAPMIKDNRVYLPARFVAQELGFQVAWQQQDCSVHIRPGAVQPAGSSPGQKKPLGPAVTSLQVSSSDESLRVVLTAEGAMDYRIFRLASPDRLVVDITGVRPGDIPEEARVNSRVVGKIRVGWFSQSPDVTRVVFDLNDGRARCRAKLSPDKRTLELEVFLPEPADVLRGRLIAVDPGHGGSDPGAVAHGLREKDLTLKIGLRLAELLSSQGAKVVLTRSGDYKVDLYERTNTANQARADLFVSVHINAAPSPDAQGTATYIIRSDMADARRWEQSRRLAERIQSNLVRDLGLQDDGVREANFAVLRTSQMAAVLVEVAYITNPREAGLLAQDWFLEKAARAIYQGIVDYLSSG